MLLLLPTRSLPFDFGGFRPGEYSRPPGRGSSRPESIPVLREEMHCMSRLESFPVSDDSELIREVHRSWSRLRGDIDRRLRLALDEQAPGESRRQSALWLAIVCEMARSLDENELR